MKSAPARLFYHFSIIPMKNKPGKGGFVTGRWDLLHFSLPVKDETPGREGNAAVVHLFVLPSPKNSSWLWWQRAGWFSGGPSEWAEPVRAPQTPGNIHSCFCYVSTHHRRFAQSNCGRGAGERKSFAVIYNGCRNFSSMLTRLFSDQFPSKDEAAISC